MNIVDYSHAREYGRLVERISSGPGSAEFATLIQEAATRAIADAAVAYTQYGLDFTKHPPEVKVSHDLLHNWFLVGWYVCVEEER